MEYEITAQRRRYLDARGYTILTACPGSGKTTSIVYKLKSIIEECEANNSNGVGVLCLSFTNRACDEIKNKFRDMHGLSINYPNEVRTIDSFLTQYVVLRYWYLTKYINMIPRIVNEEYILHGFFFHTYNGRECLSWELRDYNDLGYRYMPEKVDYIGNNTFKIDKKIVNGNDDEHLYDYCKAILRYRFSHGILNSNDAMVIASDILGVYPIIAELLANRFPYIILDEAQDTSVHQFQIIEMLKNAGVRNIEMIGDVNQSVYEWRNANPEIFQEYTRKEDWNHLNISENRRSVQRIINFYSRLKPIDYPNIISHQVEDNNIPIEVIRYNEGREKLAFEKFMSICNAHNLDSKLILVRGKSDLKKLASIKPEIKPWYSNIPNRIIDAQILFSQNMIKKATNKIIWVCADLLYGDDHFQECRNYVQAKENSIEFNCFMLELLTSLPSLSISFQSWNDLTMNIFREKLYSPYLQNFDFKKRMKGFIMRELLNKSVDTYFGQERNNAVIAQTIHSAKGASVDAVLLYLHDRSGAEVISIKDIPDGPNQMESLIEKHRLIYVACSRAKQFLSIAVPSSVTINEIQRKFNGLEINISSDGV